MAFLTSKGGVLSKALFDSEVLKTFHRDFRVVSCRRCGQLKKMYQCTVFGEVISNDRG